MRNKKTLALALMLPLIAILNGCGEKEAEMPFFVPDAPAETPTAEDYEQSYEESMESVMEWGQKYELEEYEATESLEAEIPNDFPKEFVYSSGKVTGVGNDYIDISTTDDFSEVKAFYKELIQDNNWEITSQSSEGSYYSVDAEKEDTTIYISISSDMYSSLVRIGITYSK